MQTARQPQNLKALCKILVLDRIAESGLARLPESSYQLLRECADPAAIMVRSRNLHHYEFPDTLDALGRAGTGVNNIPLERLGQRGIPVFTTPGANANAVKELVLAGMLLACRNLFPAWEYLRGLEGTPTEVKQRAEADKRRFAGFELPGRTLGVVGLGSIGVLVANAGLALGMRVIGYDPQITVGNALKLSADVKQIGSIDALLEQCDFVSFHVPLTPDTRNLLDARRLASMREGAVILNFARAEIVDESAVCDRLRADKAHAYVCDFPGAACHERVIRLPHLGASTREAEARCAEMLADELRDFLENGNIKNSVNFPDLCLLRRGAARLAVANANMPDMLGQISHNLGRAGINIVHMANESQDELAYTLVDTESPITEPALGAIRAIRGVLRARVL